MKGTVMGFFLQDDWRWIDGSVFGYHNWETAASIDQYQCLQLNSQGKIRKPTYSHFLVMVRKNI